MYIALCCGRFWVDLDFMVTSIQSLYAKFMLAIKVGVRAGTSLPSLNGVHQPCMEHGLGVTSAAVLPWPAPEKFTSNPYVSATVLSQQARGV